MKFLEDVYFAMHNFCNWHALFYHIFVAGIVAWSGIQRVDPQMIHFELIKRCTGAPSTHKQYLLV